MARHIEVCPFCNNTHLHIKSHLLSHNVICQTCKATGPRYKSIENAIKNWNTISKQLKQSRLLDYDDMKCRINNLEHTLKDMYLDMTGV